MTIPLTFGIDIIDEYGGLLLVEFLYEKLPSYLCILYRRVDHYQLICPFQLKVQVAMLHYSFDGGDYDLSNGVYGEVGIST